MRRRVISFVVLFVFSTLLGTNLYAQKKSKFGSFLKKGVEAVTGTDKKTEASETSPKETPKDVMVETQKKEEDSTIKPHLTDGTKVLIINSYTLAHCYSDGMIAVKNVDNGKYGFIDTEGNLKIDFIWYASDAFTDPRFDEGNCIVRRMDNNVNRFYIIDHEGKEQALPAAYSYVTNFVSGRAIAVSSTYGKKNIFFIDKTGKQIYPSLARSPKTSFTNPDESRSFSEGLSAYCDFVSGKWGFYDENGKLVIPTIYEKVGDFSEGLAAVLVTPANGTRPLWGFIDKTGKVVIEPAFTERPSDFFEDLAVIAKQNGKYCAMDKTGNPMGGEYDAMTPFYQGYAFVRVPGPTAVTVIDKNFTELKKIDRFAFSIQKDGYQQMRFFEGLAAAGTANPADEVQGRIINPQGETIITQAGTNARIGNFFDGLAYCRAMIGKEYYEGFINKNGEYIYVIKKSGL